MVLKAKQKSAKTQQASSATMSKTVADDTTQRPDWPPLKPLPNTLDLSFTTTLPDQILLIPNFFTTTLCKTYTAFLSDLPLTTTPSTSKRGDALRVNDRFQIHDADFANRLWSETRLRELVTNFNNDGSGGGGEFWSGDYSGRRDSSNGDDDDVDKSSILGLNPSIRIYRYRPGHFFDKHYDESNNLQFSTPKGQGDDATSIPAKTVWTLLIYLTTCEGGDTVFYPDKPPGKGVPTPAPVAVKVQAGTALLHRHGNNCLLHEGQEVTSGEKWVLRTDLVVKRRTRPSSRIFTKGMRG